MRDRWRCNLCPNQETAANYADTTTKNAINHLVKFHRFHQNGDLQTAGEGMKTGDSSLSSSNSISANTLPRILFNSDVFKQLYIRWIVTNNIPFKQATSESLRFLLMYLCAVQSSYTDLGKAMPKSSTTVNNWVQESFSRSKNSIRNLLNNAVSSIHISFDMWTSPNNLALIAIVGYWLDDEGDLHHALLGLRRVLGAHSGENQGNVIWSVIQDFKIQKLIGYFKLDNASNNITALRFIEKYINIPLAGLQFGNAMMQQNARYVRCYGHISNLVVKVFLYGKKSQQLLSFEDKKTAERENLKMERWRKVGPLGKLRNITVWIHGSPQRREAFCQSVTSTLANSTQARTLILGNVTRWTGDYDGLERALRLRHAIDFHLHQIIRESSTTIKSTIEKDQLSPNDWLVLQQVFDFLKPFRNETLLLEGHRTQGSLYEIYPSFELLRRHITTTINNPESELLAVPLQLALQKLEKYYCVEQLSPIICASIVLHPDMDNFFDDEDSGWGDRPEWGLKAKDLVKALSRETSYKRIALHATSSATAESPKRTLDPNSFAFKRIRTFKKPRLDPDMIEDELSRYLVWASQNRHEVGAPISWWIKARQTYPRLSILALDTFSTPAMSAECERVFSSAKQAITDRRNSLEESIIEAGECQKSWARSGLITFDAAGDMSEHLQKCERDTLTSGIIGQ